MSGRRPGLVEDRGSATLWVLWLAVLLAAVCGLVLSIGAVVVARHRAATAADLAALAAAAAVARGVSDPCAGADRVARAHGARLHRCVVRGLVVDVTAEGSAALGWPGLLQVSARAGPPAAR